jgi:hypothetical protein
MGPIAAIVLTAAVIWVTRTAVLRRRKAGNLGAAPAAVAVGAAWAVVPVIFQLASSGPWNWTAVLIAAVALATSSGLTVFFATRSWTPGGPK